MAKKKNLTEEVKVSETKENLDAVVVTDESVSKSAKAQKPAKQDKKAGKQDKKAEKNAKANKKSKDKDKEGFGKKIKRKSKETVSELKKVTWPGFGDVCKRTGVVLSVVILFGLILFGLDALFGFLFGLLT